MKFFRILGCAVVLAFALTASTGCQSARPSSQALVLEIPRFDDDPYLAEVALPQNRALGGNIRVFVRGEVMSPGSYVVPEGTTVLEAIKAAGGFSHFAHTAKIRMYRQGSTRVLWLQGQKRPLKRRLIWYSSDETGTRSAPEDFILEPNITIEISRTLL
jgi:hypothetical protein